MKRNRFFIGRLGVSAYGIWDRGRNVDPKYAICIGSLRVRQLAETCVKALNQEWREKLKNEDCKKTPIE